MYFFYSLYVPSDCTLFRVSISGFGNYDNKGNQHYVFANGTSWEWNQAVLPAPTLNSYRSYINSETKTYLYQVPEDFILGINIKNIDAIMVKYSKKRVVTQS